ncbi:MAG: PQQ-binding-like beta-propeller repeat protein [Flavobacteriales bacterium]
MILVIFIGLTAVSTLVVMSFTAPGPVLPTDLSEVWRTLTIPVELVPASVDSVRTNDYDALREVLEMNEKFRGSLPTSFKAGQVERGPLLNRIIEKEDGYRITTEQRSMMATPSISGNRLFVPGGFGSKVYYAFDLETHKPLWTANLDDDGPSPAACTDSLIVFNTESCTMFVLDQLTGKMLWSRWLGDPLMSTPMVAQGRVFTSYPKGIQSHDNGPSVPNTMAPSHPFVCFDLRQGTILWQVWLDGDVLSTAVADEGSIYLTTFPGTLYKLDQQTGTIQAAMGMRATSVPAIMGEEIFVTKRADKDSTVMESIAVLDRSTLGFLREFRARKAVYLDHRVQSKSRYKSSALAYDAGNGFADGAPASSGAFQAERNIGASNVSSLQAFMGSTIIPFDGSLYTLMGDSLFCLEPALGDVRWSLKITADMHAEGGTAATAPIVCDAYVVTATITGRVIVCDRRSGQVKLDLAAGGPVRYAPIMVKGKLYVPTTDGELVCLDTKDAALDGWPMLMRSADHFCAR